MKQESAVLNSPTRIEEENESLYSTEKKSQSVMSSIEKGKFRRPPKPGVNE